jgi:hypothetical protein
MIPDKVHLVGSIGLDTVEEVYRTVGKLARTAYPSRVRWRARWVAAMDQLAISVAPREPVSQD